MCEKIKGRVAWRVAWRSIAKKEQKTQNPITVEITGFVDGAPRGIRTHNLLIRSQALYPLS